MMKVPCLEIDGLVLTQSVAIMEYLADWWDPMIMMMTMEIIVMTMLMLMMILMMMRMMMMMMGMMMTMQIKEMMSFTQDYVDENLAAFQAHITQRQGEYLSWLE